VTATAVDAYFAGALVDEDDALRHARLDSAASSMPKAEVSPNQGALLGLLARMCGARRILEIGTLTGYSAIWLARTGARVTTLEVDPGNAALARANIDRAGLADRVDLVLGKAIDSLAGLTGPYDFVFIDADKQSSPAYLEACLRLTRPGSVLVLDNVVRGGAVIDPDSTDGRVRGVRRFVEMVSDDPRLDATAVQTVGAKGWDGFLLAVVR
jgi:predicted O-methyltransferase YrrM